MTTMDVETQRAGQEALDRSAVYAYLSLALLYPDEAVLAALREAVGALEAALGRLQVPGLREAAQAVCQALGSCDPPGLVTLHESVFGLASGCLPYETEYDQTHIFQKSQQLADIVAFYHAFGLDLAPDLKERADHLSVELEFMQVLAAKEAYALTRGHGADKVALCRDAQQAFLEAHLGAWSPSFSERLAQADPQGPYGALGQLLERFLAAELGAFSLPPGKPLDLLDAEEEIDPACETCPLVTGAGQ